MDFELILPFPDARWCTGCKKWKHPREFYRCKKVKSGLRSRCKVCENAERIAYRASNTEREHETTRRWRDSHPDKVSARHKKYRQNNLEKRNEGLRKWVASNLDKVRGYKRKYKVSHPEKDRQYVKNRRANLKGCVGKIIPEEIEALKVKQNYTCLCCGRREPEIKLTHDHVKPVAMHGDNTIQNSQMLCVSCNSRKRNRWIDYRMDNYE